MKPSITGARNAVPDTQTAPLPVLAMPADGEQSGQTREPAGESVTAPVPAPPSRNPRSHCNNERLGSRIPARWRIAAWILLTTALTLLAVMLTMRSLLLNGATNQAHQDLSQELEEFRAFAKEGVDPTTAQAFTSIEKMLEVYLSRQSAARGEAILGSVGPRVMYTPTGALGTHAVGHELPLDNALMEHIRTSGDVSGIVDTSAGEMHWVRLAVQSGDDTGYLIVGDYMAPREAQVADTVLTIFFVSLGGLLVTAGMAWLVAGQILQPVRAVREVAEDISESDLTSRVPVRGNDDISALAVTFNTMLDRLETAYRTQRAFVDDASHELRTPITVIRGHLELMEDNAVDRQRTLALVDDELARMGRIVSDLLLLAKVERPGFSQPKPTDAVGMLLDIEAKAQVLGARGWPILEIAEGTITVDAQRITQAVLQLATNACQYSPEGRVVSLGSRFDGEGAAREFTVWVSDEGRGVDEEEAARIFGRFHRGSAAHESDRVRPGAGLGLAIVRSIAEAHHGAAWVRSSPGKGATFGISVPAPDQGIPDGGESRGSHATTPTAADRTKEQAG
ncbi:HAMP domain-containing sensor histidine kinase [Pseudarthrobacter sp. J64]|uniref:sensor histidine kinase n=1 Tax=Pseudarthrobacter sp. J64 TaxID=3116485 RepID=UPI002E810630|nr:HAMP domain-containing sensor histidine kinase [Pseudarthrobacter sp. J64]MEE2568685.1 HAMP domain-containing sensor histidine kinase [Pseudarthrobacter sp. J64]